MVVGPQPRNASLTYPRSKVNTVNVRTHMLDVNGFDWLVETVETLEASDDELETWIGIRFENLMKNDASVWYCDAVLSWTILHTEARKSLSWSETVRLTPQQNAYTRRIAIREDFMEDKGYWNDGDECDIIINIHPLGEKGQKFYKRTVIDWNQNLEPADCCIQVEGQKFFVGKAALVRHSKHFDSVFFGSDGVDLTPFILTDASKQDFRLFLNYIHRCDNSKISAENVLVFIQIAKRLQSEGILAKAENFVVKSNQFRLSIKIELAEMYELPGLKDHCEHLLANCGLADINNIMATASYATWSEEIKANTVKRLQQIANEQQSTIDRLNNSWNNPFQQFGPSPSLFGNHPPVIQNHYLNNNNPPPPPIRPAPAAPRQRRAPVRRRAPPAAPQPAVPLLQQNLLAPTQNNNWQPMMHPQAAPVPPQLQPRPYQPQPAPYVPPNQAYQPQPAQPPNQLNQPVYQPQLAQILAQGPAPVPAALLPVPAPKRRRVNIRAAAQQP